MKYMDEFKDKLRREKMDEVAHLARSRREWYYIVANLVLRCTAVK